MARPKKEETLKQICIRIDDNTRKKLQSESEKNNDKFSDTIRKIIEKHFEK
jgi:predicted DNA-binding protein